MTRIKLYLEKTDEDQVWDSQGPVSVYHKRLSTLVWAGTCPTPRDGWIDTGSPLNIIPELVWTSLQSEIEWFTTPPSHQLKHWCTTIAGVTGGSVTCKLGRINLILFDLGGNELGPFPIVAKFANDKGLLGRRVILGLWGGVLEGRRLVLDSAAAAAWLEEQTRSRPPAMHGVIRHSGHDAVTDQVVGQYNPRTQSWSEHFRWSGIDLTLIEPRTPTGRVTLTLLEMNGPRHVQVREWLIALDVHPPPETQVE